MTSPWHVNESLESQLDEAGAEVDRHNYAVSRAVDAVVATMYQHGRATFHEDKDALFEFLSEMYGTPAREATKVLNEHTLNGAVFNYVPEKASRPAITNPQTYADMNQPLTEE